MTYRRALLAFFALPVLLQAGCTLLPESKPLRVFMLPMPIAQEEPATFQKLPLSLRVRSLQANQLLTGNRIAVVPKANEISVYSGVRWADPAPVLLRDRLLEAFIASGRLVAVFSEENRLQADMELSGVLGSFQSEYVAGQPQVRMQLDLRLTDAGGRRLLASRRFEVTEASRDESIEEVVASFGRAADVLSQQVVEWTLSEIAAFAN